MQENKADHLIKINRWLYACARFIEASKELTDYDIDGINHVVDIMRSSYVRDRNKSDIPCDLCIHNPPSSFGGKPCATCPAEGDRHG